MNLFKKFYCKDSNINGLVCFFSLLSLITLMLIPAHTKLASVALIALCLLFIMNIFYKIEGKEQWGSEKNENDLGSIRLLERMITFWLVVCCLAYLIKLGIQTYYQEFNDASSFHSRNVAIALCLYLSVVKFKRIHNLNFFLDKLPLFLYGSLIFILLLGGIFWKKISFGTNQIPWVAGISIFSISIHVLMLQFSSSWKHQILGWLYSIIVMGVILYIGVRGSYFYGIWLLFLISGFMLISLKKEFNSKKVIFSTIMVVLGVSVTLFLVPNIFERGFYRVYKAINEIDHFINLGVEGADTSVGARLYMWTRSLEFIQDGWLFGYGKSGTELLISQFALESQSGIIRTLNQVHNEYLQALLTYGVFGLLSFLLYPLGLIYLAWRVRKFSIPLSVGFVGIVFLFLTVGLTNTNTYHNYFGTVFSISIVLLFLLGLREQIIKVRFGR